MAKGNDVARYTRDRIEYLMRGGTALLAYTAMDGAAHPAAPAMVDPSELIEEKVDVERALAGIGLTDKQRAMGALLAMGWSPTAISKVLHTNTRTIFTLRDGDGGRPGLAARLEAFLNGEEAP